MHDPVFDINANGNAGYLIVVWLVARQINKKLSWCWQTCATRLGVSRGQQTWYHFGSVATFRYSMRPAPRVTTV